MWSFGSLIAIRDAGDLARRLVPRMRSLEGVIHALGRGERTAGTIADGEAEPVASVALLVTGNTAPTTITALRGVGKPQVVTIIAGDAVTTLAPSPNLRLRGGVSRTLALNETTQFVTRDGVTWSEVPCP